MSYRVKKDQAAVAFAIADKLFWDEVDALRRAAVCMDDAEDKDGHRFIALASVHADFAELLLALVAKGALRADARDCVTDADFYLTPTLLLEIDNRLDIYAHMDALSDGEPCEPPFPLSARQLADRARPAPPPPTLPPPVVLTLDMGDPPDDKLPF